MRTSLLSAEVIEPYAEALMSLGDMHNLSDRFGEDARALGELLETSQALSEFISNPILKAEDKKAVLRRIAGRDFHPYMVNFLMLLVDKKRIVFVDGICQKYLELLRQRNQTVLAEITSAAELNDQQRRAVIEKVKQMTQAQAVELKTAIDPDLIGGVVIKVGSQVLDASLRGQLRRLKSSLV